MTYIAAGPPPAAPENTLKRHIARTLVLALPIILSRVGIIAMTTVDVVVVGRAGAEQLAFYVLGQTIADFLIAVMVGLQLGVSVQTARAIGAGEDEEAGRIWKAGLVYALVLAGIIVIAMQFATPFFRLIGQSEDLIEGGALITRTLAFAIPGWALFIVSSLFLEALGRPLMATIAVLVANVANLALNIVLVFGWGPIPALGAFGCALATIVTGSMLGLGLLAYIRFKLPGRDRYRINVPMSGLWPFGRLQRGIGYAAGLSYGFEAGSFAVMVFLAGLISAMSVAAYGILFQFLGLSFMIAFGIAAATQVRVGNAWGRKDRIAIVLAGWVGFGLTIAIMAVNAVFFLSFPELMLRFFTNEEAVIAVALPAIGMMALALTFDGGQSVISHACRGRGDTWVPTLLHFLSYWVFMIPLAYWLAIAEGGGVPGLFLAIWCASIVSLVLMASRFMMLARRPV